MLRAHDRVPPFTVVNEIDGRVIEYADLWQRRNLVLVCLAPGDASRDVWVRELLTDDALRAADTELIVTIAPVEGAPVPGVLVADRWGEIRYVSSADSVAALPSAADVAEWVEYVRHECPECQGEAR